MDPTVPHMAADLAVTLAEDRPGMLAKAIGCVSGAGINIDGYTEMNGAVHVLTTDQAATRRVLAEAGSGSFKSSRSCWCRLKTRPGLPPVSSRASPRRTSTSGTATSPPGTAS